MTSTARREHVNGSPVAGREGAPRWSPGFPGTASPAEPPGEQGPSAAEETQQVENTSPAPARETAGAAEPDRDASAGPDPAWGPSSALGPPSALGSDVELSSARLVRPVKRVPRSGWRAALYNASGGLINPGESEEDAARRELSDRVRQRLTGCYRIAAISVKGGVGKTTTTVGLGSAFASLRGDRVVALDANPDRGNLVEKVPAETTATVRHLLADAEHIRSAADVRAYTSQAPSRLEVLASESDPAVSEAYDAGEYQATIDLLSRHYNILLTDCGTGLLHSALQAAVEVADTLLIITSASIDGANAAQATVDWLEAHGHRELVARSVTVINGVRPRPTGLDLDAVERYFAAHTREVVRIPHDPHLDEGAEIDLDQLATGTRDALLALAAVVADDFARPGRTERGARRRTPALLPGTGEHPIARPGA